MPHLMLIIIVTIECPKHNHYLRNSWMVPNHDEETRSKFRNPKKKIILNEPLNIWAILLNDPSKKFGHDPYP